MSLVKVIDGGADFEHRIVGDGHVQAFRVSLQNRRFSEIACEAPELISISQPNFLKVVQTRAPLAFRGNTGRDAVNVLFTNVESIFLPLGETDEAVDHVVVFGVYDRE